MTKNILIAGGTSGIGAETLALLREDGHEVYCACRSPEKLPEDPHVHGMAFDAADPSKTPALPETLDGFVYFPGTITLKPLGRLTADDFLHDLQVNFLGAVGLLQRALPSLLKGTDAAAVFFSTVAVRTGLPFHASISAAKGAVEGLTRSLAAELAPRIRVNCIAPSLTDTTLAASLVSSDEKKASSAKRHPLNRIGDPKEIAGLVQFLLGTQSLFMTGNIIKADGGLSSVKLF
ncbi:MAG: oxidoreductase [Roseibacillus sp.]|nr:oxidoreductase [Roseibacillus sp.]